MEDHIYPLPGQASLSDKLFIVCDGLGGQSFGDVASRLTCTVISDFLLNLDIYEICEKDIQDAVEAAVLKLKDYAVNARGAEKMATTLTLAFLQPNGIWLAWCGDSRIYHIRNGSILWKSKDHSLVQHLLDSGRITEFEARYHPKRNVILQCISAQNSITKIDTQFIADIVPGDYILLCTDGLLENISEIEIKNILEQNQLETDKKQLFLDYCIYKTRDNYSMYLLGFD